MKTLANKPIQSEQGFTLIELLVTISILGILAAISLPAYRLYISSAGYRVSLQSVRDARIALEASTTSPDAVIAAVTFSQSSPGRLSDATAVQLLPEFQVSPKTSFAMVHDPDCLDAGCVADSLVVRHCRGTKYAFFTRYGDGAEALVEDLPGSGC